MRVFSLSTKIEERKRLSCAFLLTHTSQSQAINGTPCEVPVPKNVTFIDNLTNLSLKLGLKSELTEFWLFLSYKFWIQLNF